MNYTNGQPSGVEDVSRVAKNKAQQAKRMVDEKVSSVSDVISERTHQLSTQLSEISQQLREKAEAARDRTTETVGRHPFYSLGAAVAAGLALGFLFGRGRKPNSRG